ncbi:hypothetical protein ACLI4Y_13885 [Natrialbaceae archaeon A-CW3]
MTPDPTHDDAILTPDDLEVTPDNETVTQLGENRYVVRSDSDSSNTDLLEGLPTPGAVDLEDAGSAGERTRGVVSDDPAAVGLKAGDDDAGTQRDEASLAAASEPHGVEITLKTDGELAHHRATSHDVREVFADLLTWYASQLDDEMSPTEALQVLLATTDLEAEA